MADEIEVPKPDKVVNLDKLTRGNSKAPEAAPLDDQDDEPINDPIDDDQQDQSQDQDDQDQQDDSQGDHDQQDQDDSQQDDSQQDEGSQDDGQQDQDESSDELDLETYEYDGRPVSDIIAERNQLAERVAKFESDPFLKKFLAHYEAKGDPRKFLEVHTENWDKKDDVRVLEAKFLREYADLPDDLKRDAFIEQIKKDYGINPFEVTDEDKSTTQYKLAMAKIKRDADRSRSEFKKEQEDFQIPVPNTEDLSKQAQEYRQKVYGEERVKKFIDTKMLKLGITDDDGQAYGFESQNPQSVVEMALDESKFWGQFVDPKTRAVNWDRVQKTLAYSQDPEGFEKQIFEFGKQVGQRLKGQEDRNSDGRLNRRQDVPAENNERVAILKAFRDKGRKRNF